ncbi:hypothetical protein BOTCAL_0278g00100 [Botryotinia calthae]|uniref:Protein kinase domain-containing protein n=1 Tax=Botryotinia calthae TaxID=38488 RepID=A0A4Y8CXQ8_9HELO|nr:hypothetical protein BOTCAL_0278g00100 [Botryotinia calthae]
MGFENQAIGIQNASPDISPIKKIAYTPMELQRLSYTPPTTPPSPTPKTGANQLSLKSGSLGPASKPQPLKKEARRYHRKQPNQHRNAPLTNFKQGIVRIKRSFHDGYKILRVIGHGGFGTVSSIEEIATNKLFAIKIEKKPSRRTTLRKEWDLHKKLNHPSILRVYDFYVCKDEASKMIMDLGEKTMFNMLREKRYIEEAQMKVYFKDILLGLEYLKSKEIVHRDIKPYNVILGRGSGGRAMIADFGMAEHLIDGERSKWIFKGTLHYLAPECFSKESRETGVGFELDIWAAGVSLFTCLLGYHPFNSSEPTDSKKQHVRNMALMIQNDKPSIDAKTLQGPMPSKEAADLFFKMLEKDWVKRFTVEDCLKQAWFSE